MPFKKGSSGNKEGRPTGSKNTKTIEWEQLKESILSTHTDRFNKILTNIDDKGFIDAYLKTIQYFKPRLKFSKIEDVTSKKEIADLFPIELDEPGDL